jgi:hypothetical protein
VRRRARKCAGIRGYVGVHLGVHFRNVGVHWVLYPTPPATRQRQPCACQPLPQCTPWQARHKATAPAVAHTQQRSHIHKPPPHGPAAQLNPPRAHPATVCECGSIARTAQSQGEPTPEGQVSTVHRPPFQNAMHSRTDGARITLKPKLPGEPSRLHFAPLTHRRPPQVPAQNPSGYDHFYRGHRGQTATTLVSRCLH